MAKFTFSFDGDDTAVSVEYALYEEDISTEVIISKFEQFLKGCGIAIDGKLKIVDRHYDDIFIDLNEDWSNYQTTPAHESPFSAVVDDHINLTDAFPDMMSVDLDIPKTCGSAGCGKCGCGKNAN